MSRASFAGRRLGSHPSRSHSGEDAARGTGPEKPILEHLHDYANLMLANLLWLLFSLPLVTLPAATAGLAAVMAAWVHAGRPDVVRVFFTAARRQFGRATLLALSDLALAAPLLVNLLIIDRAVDPGQLLLAARGVCVAALVFLAAVNLFLWPSLESGARLGVLWRRAAVLVLLRPLPALLTLAATVLVMAFGLLLPRAVFLFFSVAAAAYVASWCVLRIERRLPERFANLADQRQAVVPGTALGAKEAAS